MADKNDGFRTDHIKSKCCNAVIRFEPLSNGYSISAWCQKCGNYIFNSRTETLICLWLGDKEAVIKNVGYMPKWVEEK